MHRPKHGSNFVLTVAPKLDGLRRQIVNWSVGLHLRWKSALLVNIVCDLDV